MNKLRFRGRKLVAHKKKEFGMKKIIVCVLSLCACVGLFAQQPTVAVAAFDVQGGISVDEANVVYELFITELVSTGAVRVLDRYNLDKIMAEMKFQATDWSDRQKTASLGRALNANIIIRGRLMKMGGTIYWTATMLNINTAQVLFSSRQTLKDIKEVWGKLPDFCKQLVSKVNMTPPQGLSTVAVSTFDVQGGITPDEASVITELFITELVSTNEVNVLDRASFDKIITEMKFQTSDWSDGQKTAALGRATNAGNIIRGQLMKMGDTIFWTATMLDVNTAQVLHSSRLQLKDLNEVINKLPEFRQQMMAKIPPPNLFVGRWQCNFSRWKSWQSDTQSFDLFCILNIKADGSVLIERYDIITNTQNRITHTFRDDDVTHTTELRSYKGTGKYTSIIRDSNDNISIIISMTLDGIPKGANTNDSRVTGTPFNDGKDIGEVKATINLKQTYPFKINIDWCRLKFLFRIYKENGQVKYRNYSGANGESYQTFTKLD